MSSSTYIRRRPVRLPGLTCLVVALSLVTGAASATDTLTHEQADSVYRLSGLDATIENFVVGLGDGISQQAAAFPVPIGEAVAGVAELEVDMQAVHDNGVAQIAAGLSVMSLPALMTWYESPLGVRITALEAEHGRSDQAQLQAKMQQYSANPPTEARAALASDLLHNTGSIDTLRVVLRSSSLAIALGANASRPEQMQAAPEQLVAQIDAGVNQMIEPLTGVMFVSVLSTYETLTDAELAQYNQFLDSDAGSAMNTVAAKLLENVATERSFALGHALGKAITAAQGQHAS